MNNRNDKMRLEKLEIVFHCEFKVVDFFKVFLLSIGLLLIVLYRKVN